MGVKYGRFQLPTKIKVDESAKKPHFARFIAEPFEPGYGHTLGNTFRRMLLTSMEAPAIISVRIEGIAHEYMALDGIIEDMTHIVLNLKGALLRKLPTDQELQSREPKLISKDIEVTTGDLSKKGGQYVVTLGELLGHSDFEVVNPNTPIFTITKPMKRRVDLRIAIGRGYVPSERVALPTKVVDEIVIDALFSPVRLVNYFIENTRVGQDTDYDRLVLEVTTDGRVTPEEALSFATQIGILHLQVFEQLKMLPLSFEKSEEELNTDRDALLAKLCLKINEIELSVRSTNCLASAGIETIGELVLMDEPEMLKFRNFGKKSLGEIKAKLEQMGLSLGIDLSKMGIHRDNVKAIVQEYLEQKAGKETV